MIEAAPYHAHIYYSERGTLSRRVVAFGFASGRPEVLFVGRMTDGGVGPHPLPQFEVHFRAPALETVVTSSRRRACARWFTR